MSQTSDVRRPRVGSMVVLAMLSGFASLYLGWTGRSRVISGYYRLPIVYGIYAYTLLVLGVVLIIDAALVAAYKRIGLKIGLAVYLLNTVISVISLIISHFPPLMIGMLLIDLVVLFYFFRYLLHQPEKSFFT